MRSRADANRWIDRKSRYWLANASWRHMMGNQAIALSMSAALLAAETDGLAWVTNDEAVSDYGSLTIKDTVTPANNYSGAPFTFQGGKLTHARGSTAYQLNASGLWESVAVNTPKVYRDPSTLTNYGYWPEEQRTNRITYSDDLSNAAWTKTSCTAAKTATGIGGEANGASTLTATAANGYARFPITAASAQCITSTFVKRRTGTGPVKLSQGETTGSELVTNGAFTTDVSSWTGVNATLASVSSELEITADGAGQARATQSFTTVVGKVYRAEATMRRGTGVSNLDILITGIAQSPAVTTTSNTTVSICFVANNTTTTIRPGTSSTALAGGTYYVDNVRCKEVVETTLTVTSGWTRVATPAATITDPTVIINLETSGDEIDVQCVQNEAGAFVTSPIPTAGATATRLADSIANFTAFNIGTSGTLYSKTTFTGVGGGSILALYDTTANEKSHIYYNGGWVGNVFDGGVTQAVFAALGTTTAGVQNKLALAFATNDFAAVKDGGTVATDVSGTLPTATALSIATAATTGQAQPNAAITEIMHLPRRMSNAELQALTT